MSSKFSTWISKYGISPQPLIHAGAHYGEERFDYMELGFGPVYWIEALPSVARICLENLLNFPSHHLIIAAISDSINESVTFFVAGKEDSSSSMLEPNLISASHPEVTVSEKLVLSTTTLDALLASGFFGEHHSYGLVLDLQGAEEKALRGGAALLQNVNFVITEVSTRELYKGGARFDELVIFFDSAGFGLIESDVNRTTGWGEAIFINRSGMYSELLRKGPQINVVNGNFSLGTRLRAMLLFLKMPHKYLKYFARK